MQRRLWMGLIVAGLAIGLGACGDDETKTPATSNNGTNNGTNNGNNVTNNGNNVTNNGNNVTNNGAGCTTNAECFTANGAGSICMAGACESMLSTECTAARGPWDQENLVIVGTILPTTGDYASIGVPIENAVAMAVGEFKDNGGIGGDRTMVLLGCDSAGSTEQGVAAATHLAAVGAPAIVGPAFSGIYLQVVTTVTKNAGVMTMSPSATSPTITDLDDGGLAWRTAPSDAFQGVAMADRVRDIQDAATPFRVIAFGKDDAYGQGLLNTVTADLGAHLGADNFVGSIYDNPGDVATPNIPEKVSAALTLIPNPDVVMLLGTNEVFTVLELLEAEVSAGDLVRPKYIVSDGGKLDEAITAVTADATLADGPIEIVTPAGENGAVYAGYNDRFNAAYGKDAGVYSAQAYDATYLIGFALCSIIGTNQEVTGGNIASSMGDLITGTPTPARPSNIAAACAALAGGGKIDFDGASGPLNFDLATGEAPGNATLFDVWQKRPGEFEFRTIGQYNSAGGVWAYE